MSHPLACFLRVLLKTWAIHSSVERERVSERKEREREREEGNEEKTFLREGPE